jgi:hypothetical protein
MERVEDSLTARASALSAPPPPPPAGRTTIVPGNADTMPFLVQTGNGCGTTSLAMIASYLKGEPITQAHVDKDVRRNDIFSAPGDLVEFARDEGLAAEMYNHGTWDEMKGLLDRGIPCQALISHDGSDDLGKLHLVAVVGYQKDSATGEDQVIMHDPNFPFERTMSLKDFNARWMAPPAGFDNFFIAYAPGGTRLPPGRTDGIEGTLTTGNGVANLSNGLDRLRHFYDSPGTLFRGTFEVSAGLGQTVGGAVYTGFQLGGAWLDNAVAGVPVVRNVVQPLARAIESTGAIASDLMDGAGEAVADFGEALEDLGKGDVKGFANEVKEGVEEVVGGVASAVEDTVSGGVGIIKSIFSW